MSNFLETVDKSGHLQVYTGPNLVYSTQDRANIVSTIVLPILMLAALSCAVHFLRHPVGEMVPITHNFSMRLPLLVASATGVGLTLIFVLQLARKEVHKSWGRFVGNIVLTHEELIQLVNQGLMPCGRSEGVSAQDHMNDKDWKFDLAKSAIEGQIVEMQAKNIVDSSQLKPDAPQPPDEITLRGIWHVKPENKRTVVLFHGNGMNAEDMYDVGARYKNRGFNVLLFEIRGYGMSEGSVPLNASEVGALYDLKALFQFLKSQNIDIKTVVAHGYSLGGFYATAFCYYFGAKYLIADHTFSSGGAVFQNVPKMALGQILEQKGFNSKPSCDFVTIESTMSVAEVTADSKQVIEDKLIEGQLEEFGVSGWNSAGLVSKMQTRVNILVIQGKEDTFMGKIAEQFIPAANYDKKMKEKRLITVDGGHGEYNALYSDPSGYPKYKDFFVESGLVSKEEIETW